MHAINKLGKLGRITQSWIKLLQWTPSEQTNGQKWADFQTRTMRDPLALKSFMCLKTLHVNSIKLSEERRTWEFQDHAELITAKRFLVIRRETLPTQLVSEIIFPQTQASLRTGIRTEDTDRIEVKTSCKLIDRSSVSAVQEVVVLITVPSHKRTWVGSQRHLNSFARKPERSKSAWTFKLAILALF